MTLVSVYDLWTHYDNGNQVAKVRMILSDVPTNVEITHWSVLATLFITCDFQSREKLVLNCGTCVWVPLTCAFRGFAN